MEKSWHLAISKVLQENSTPLHYSEISQQIKAKGYYDSTSLTPDTIISSYISASIAHDGENSPYERTGIGTYKLKQPVVTPILQPQDIAFSPIEEKKTNTIIRSFGMYWQRDCVIWKNDPKLFGKQQLGMAPIDFGKQYGIYILYDYHTVVYVGRSIDRPIGKRLYEHTVDRLAGRWNRFSWFGFSEVIQGTVLQVSPEEISKSDVITLMESILIEVLEPPQNRRRGDYMPNEYIQEIDPELKERELLRFLEQKIKS